MKTSTWWWATPGPPPSWRVLTARLRAEGGKVVEAVARYSQVDISARVQDFDPEAPEGLAAAQLVLSGWATEPNRVTARTSATAAKAAATASAPRRSTA